MPVRAKKATRRDSTAKGRKRSLFRELMSGVEAMGEHREGRLTLRTQPPHLPCSLGET